MGGLIGNYQIPYATISEALSVVTIVVNKYNGQLARQSLAKELGLVANGGGFINKLSTVKGYGLLEGTGNLSATDLAQTIVLSKDSKQVARSKAKAFLNYPLYQRLFERMKDKVPDDEALTNILVEITKTSRIEVSKKVTEIRKYYMDALQYLKILIDEESVTGTLTQDQQLQIGAQPLQRQNTMSTMSMEAPRSTVHEVSLVPTGFEEIKMGEVKITLRPDLDDVATAKGLIALYERKLRAKIPKSPRSKSPSTETPS